MSLSVIGAGFPRTGTLSLKLALERLGFGPCYHMTEVFSSPASWPWWARVADGETGLWDEIFKGYGASTDAPGCWFYRELADHFPNARVVLSERDGERWFKSMSETILADSHRDTMTASPVGAVIRRLASRTLFGAGADMDLGTAPPGKEQMIAGFLAHNSEVRRSIPADRLLVFEARNGWGPLCDFLGVPVPDEPFPHVNSAEEFKAIPIPS
jgi:hypothetical protein